MRLILFLLALTPACVFANEIPISSGSTNQLLWMQNACVRVEYDQAAERLRVVDRRDNSLVIDDLNWWTGSPLPSSAPLQVELSAFTGMGGSGEQLRLIRQRTDGLDETLSARLYDNDCFLEFGFAVANHRTNDIHIKEFGINGLAFPSQDFPDYWELDGEDDGYATHVSNGGWRTSANNLLATFGLPGRRKHSLVIGGLHYQEFMRHCKIVKTSNHLNFEVKADDPYGKLVKANTSYEFPDTIYLDVLTDNRFEALEAYGRALAQANNVKLNVPDMPVINLWYVQEPRFGNGPFEDNSAGAVWTARDAKKSGFLKYAPVGIRLEPDDYSEPDNQQGWWDDEHWQKYPSGGFVKPYETLAKWCAAVQKLGATPFIYCQTARRSEDFCQKFPEYMLFNHSDEPRPSQIEWFKDKYWSYDFTDPGFIAHMQSVYANLRRAGVRGMKFDYPTTGWDYMGGFQDPFATTCSAYRNIFKLALDGLGPGCDVQERLGAAGDVVLGALTTKRIQEDTDKLYPPMVTRAGLSWYKNRVAVYYDLDAKNPDHGVPTNSIDGARAMFTMTALVSGRLEVGKYLGLMSPEQLQVLSRVVPLYLGPQSARPVDAFSTNKFPRIYDLKVQPGWHQLTFYNTAIDGTWTTDWEKIIHPLQGQLLPATIGVDLGSATDDGGLGLDPKKLYYIFDFWNDHYIGCIRGSDRLSQQLRPGEARMMSIHEKLDHPQFISTNRHILQGVLDMVKCEWQPQKKKLVGNSRLLVADEPYIITIAENGFHIKTASAAGAKISWQARPESPDLLSVSLLSHVGGSVDWQIDFE
jgi:hypothetical protein